MRRATFLRTSLMIRVTVAGAIFPSSVQIVSQILFPQQLQSIFTFPMAPLLVISRDAPSRSNHPIISFHAYPEKLVFESWYVDPEKSIHQAVSDQAYPERDHIPAPVSVRQNSISCILTHPIVSTQKLPVRTCPLSVMSRCHPLYADSTGFSQNRTIPGFPLLV